MAFEVSTRKRWNEEETLLALYLYFQLPFGKLHSGNPEVQELAAALGRTNSSVAMKLDTRNNHDFADVIGSFAEIAARDAI